MYVRLHWEHETLWHGDFFKINQRGEYQKKATALITIEPKNLATANASGFDFLRIASLELYRGLKTQTQTQTLGKDSPAFPLFHFYLSKDE